MAMTMQENRIQRKIGQMCAKKQMRHTAEYEYTVRPAICTRKETEQH